MPNKTSNSFRGLFALREKWEIGLLAIFFILINLFAIGQNTSKSGGVCFRVDDNPGLIKLKQFDSIFSKYQKNFCLAITSGVLPLSPDYVSALKGFTASGHEIMDNTPNLQTQSFTLHNIQDTALYSNEWGVDHFNGQKVCLKYTSIDLSNPHGEGPINVFGNQIISENNGEFADLNGDPYFFAIYIPYKDSMYLWYDLKNKNPNDPDSLKIKSFWGESVDIGTQWFFNYKKLTQRDVYMHPSAIKLLGKQSRKIFDDLQMDRPTTWIHPVGQAPWLNSNEVKVNLGDSLGYTCGSNFKNFAYFTYNEYNNDKTKQFSLQSGDISIEKNTFQWNKSKIADAFAKHFVKVDLSYFSNSVGGWNAYLYRLDSLLSWCVASNIPIKTFHQWSAFVYDSLPNRGVNIFPKLHADLDGDGFPDGYDQDTSLEGHYSLTDGVSASGGRCFELLGTGSFCRVTMLGGVEKGSNKFTLWVKRTSADTSRVVVEFSFPETGTTQTFEFLVDSTIWVKKDVILSIPVTASLVNILIKNEGQNLDIVKISGMDLRSSGFLMKTKYPAQDVFANVQFDNVNLNALVNDSIYVPSTIEWSIGSHDTMNLSILPGNILRVLKPLSFWTGRDSSYIVARSPEGVFDSCFMNFISRPIPNECSGVPIMLSLLDTLSNDIIQWTSTPHDSSMSDTTVYNPVVAPKVTTKYMVTCTNPFSGNINIDSITLVRYPLPIPGLPADTMICIGDSVRLTVLDGTRFLWSTGDTVASIVVKPTELTTYTVVVFNDYKCSVTDSARVIVINKPDVILHGLAQAYCVNDWAATIYGTPFGGILDATSGLFGNQFFPERANIGMSKVWYTYTDPTGCSATDTVKVMVYDLPHILPQPDTTICAGNIIVLNAGAGFDNYQWSNGKTEPIIMVDSTGYGIGIFQIWIYVTKDGCASKDFARIKFALCPGMEENSLAKAYTVYPNPATMEIYLQAKSAKAEPLDVQIFNYNGIIVSKKRYFDILNKITISDLPKGAYIMRILKGNEAAEYMFIKN
ncbi:MAG: T9SS type A sorting domain-containing protein [Bacteroidota bacterium]